MHLHMDITTTISAATDGIIPVEQGPWLVETVKVLVLEMASGQSGYILKGKKKKTDKNIVLLSLK